MVQICCQAPDSSSCFSTGNLVFARMNLKPAALKNLMFEWAISISAKSTVFQIWQVWNYLSNKRIGFLMLSNEANPFCQPFLWKKTNSILFYLLAHVNLSGTIVSKIFRFNLFALKIQ